MNVLADTDVRHLTLDIVTFQDVGSLSIPRAPLHILTRGLIRQGHRNIYHLDPLFLETYQS